MALCNKRASPNKCAARFMWVRAQIDYLQRLPNDAEKRKALEQLPPDLHQTYGRILDTIDSSYPVQTTRYIQRILKWLVLVGDDDSRPDGNGHSSVKLSIFGLSEAICIEDGGEWPTSETVPTKDQIVRWLGCLGRVTKDSNRLQLSHFTIREFLQMATPTICSPAVQKFLDLSQSDGDDDQSTFCYYVAASLIYHVHLLSDRGTYDSKLIRMFLSVPPSPAFRLWAAYHSKFPGAAYIKSIPSPIHFACMTDLASQGTRLLQQGTDPDDMENLKDLGATPLHVAISNSSVIFVLIQTNSRLIWHSRETFGDASLLQNRICSRKMVRSLVKFGADVNRRVICSGDDPLGGLAVTPLTLAISCGDWEMANHLLNAGADWHAIMDRSINSYARQVASDEVIDMYSIQRVLECNNPDLEHTVQRVLDVTSRTDLRDRIQEWRLQRDRNSPDEQTESPTMSESVEDSVHYCEKEGLLENLDCHSVISISSDGESESPNESK
ncbi:MAG: hypothetical protein Q9169_003973 [Polycauliona sp. 2 TL-2023]